ncbi:MAG: FAD-dependent oxidoreductase, partial [Planctomycetota bacterium]
EPRNETGEELAPEQGDDLVMGTSVQWYSIEEQESSTFPKCPWAVQFDDKTCVRSTRGDWDWETGALRDQVTEFERIRDYALRVTFGNWAVLKNHERFKNEFANRRLAWVAYIGGKRESRRLLGDVILRQQDIVNRTDFPDACVTATWSIDLHYPKKPACACEAFRSEARTLKIEPYAIPYRCLYSRNVRNLMMAGRNISVTHVALGTVRVQRTTGMMGEVLGLAVSLCKNHGCDPRGVYEKHLAEFRELLEQGVPPAQTP